MKNMKKEKKGKDAQQCFKSHKDDVDFGKAICIGFLAAAIVLIPVAAGVVF